MMWRILQNFPRAIRQTWNSHIRSAPQTVHQEDEHNNWHGELLSSPTANVKFVSIATAARDSCFANTEVNFDRDWREWRRTHGNSWQSLHQSYSTLEAIGWGTAVVLGLQITRLYRLIHGDDQGRNFEQRSCPLYRLAYGMPHGRGVALQILPDAPKTKVGDKVNEKLLPDNPSKHQETVETSYGPFSSKSVYTSQPQTATREPDGKETHTEHFDEPAATGDVQAVWNEYIALADTYNSISNHITGVQYARAGQYAEALRYWQIASDAGYAKAQYNLGLCYETGRGTSVDLHEAVRLYQLAAASDHAQALYNLAVMHLHGLGGLSRDNHQALLLLEKASKQGLLQAQLWLGILCTKAEHQDYEKAVQQFDLAAQNGDATAVFYLASCYENGLGVSQNECKAADLYARAAKKGHVKAQHKLAEYFESGRGGLPEDRTSAVELYGKASQAGHKPSAASLTRLQREIEAEKTRLSSRDSGFQGMEEVDSRYDLTLKRPAGSVRTCASSPSFTEYIRAHLHKFGFMLDSLSENRSNLRTDHAESAVSSSSARFYISEDEEEEEDMLTSSHQELIVSPSGGGALQRSCSSAELHRSASLNDSRALLCM